MGATVNKSELMDAMEENQKDVRRMVMDSYHDIERGKGRDYKEFFAELESRYRNISYNFYNSTFEFPVPLILHLHQAHAV